MAIGNVLTRCAALGACVLFLLTGCVQPKLTGNVSADLSIKSVRVQTATLSKAVTGRKSSITKEQLGADIGRVLKQRIVGRSGTVHADLIVDVKEVNLVSRGVAALAPVQSTARVVLSVKERGTNRMVVPPTEITAASAIFRMGGLIGVVTTPSVAADYEGTLKGLANAVEKRLYGQEN